MALNLGKSVVDFLTAHPEEKFSARQIAEKSMAIAGRTCIYTNDSIIYEELG